MRAKRRKGKQLGHALYLRAERAFDSLELFGVATFPIEEAPSRMWFRLRAWKLGFQIVQHKAADFLVILRLK